MNKTLFLSAAALVASFAASAHAATITGLWNTGVDALGNPLAEGAPDLHYLVNGSPTPFVYDHPSYLVPSDARFIAVQPNGGYVNPVNTFSLTFSLAGLNAATAQLSGFFESDNYASVYLNGHFLTQDIQATVVSNFQSYTPFSAGSSDFVAGLNTLSFVVTDTGPPSAVLVRGLTGTANASGAVPEPAAWALMLVGFGGLGAALRARRKAFATA